MDKIKWSKQRWSSGFRDMQKQEQLWQLIYNWCATTGAEKNTRVHTQNREDDVKETLVSRRNINLEISLMPVQKSDEGYRTVRELSSRLCWCLLYVLENVWEADGNRKWSLRTWVTPEVIRWVTGTSETLLASLQTSKDIFMSSSLNWLFWLSYYSCSPNALLCIPS